jgi:hypothetical protein
VTWAWCAACFFGGFALGLISSVRLFRRAVREADEAQDEAIVALKAATKEQKIARQLMMLAIRRARPK